MIKTRRLGRSEVFGCLGLLKALGPRASWPNSGFLVSNPEGKDLWKNSESLWKTIRTLYGGFTVEVLFFPEERQKNSVA